MKKLFIKPLLLVLLTGISGYLAAQGCSVTAAMGVFQAPTGTTVSFSDQSQLGPNTAITSYTWDFGDGSPMLNSSQTVHTYQAPGTYTVCLYISAQGNGTICGDSVCNTVTITNSTGGCSTVLNSTNNGSIYTFWPTVTGGTAPYTYSWTFGDGGTATTSQTSHTYTQPGNYTACITVTDANGCVSSDCMNLSISGPGLAPANDLVCNATPLTCGNTLTGSTASATPEVNISMPACTSSYTNSRGVWFLYNSGTDSLATISLCGSTFDTKLNIYTGPSCTSLNSCVAANDDACGMQSSITFRPAPNTNYWILVSAFAANQSGNYSIRLDCDSPQIVPSCNASFTYTVVCDTVQFINTSTGSFTSQSWYFSPDTDTSSNPTYVFPAGGQNIAVLTISGPNCQDSYTAVVNTNPCYTDSVCGTLFIDANGNGILDQGESTTSGYITIDNRFAYPTDSLGHYAIPVSAGYHTIRYCAPQGYVFTLPNASAPNSGQTNCAQYDSVLISGGMNCGFNFAIQNTTVHVCGTVFYDANNNGTQDANESGLQNIRVSITGGGRTFTAFTNSLGGYCINVPAATYSISISASWLTNVSVLPPAITLAATTIGNQYLGNNFAVYFQAGTGDLAVNITPHTTVTPGFPAWYDVQVLNVGPTPMSAVVTLYYENNRLRFDRSNPIAASHNATTGTLTWNTAMIQPGQSASIWVDFDGIIGTALGTNVFTLASIAPGSGFTDANAANNIDTVHQIVVGSWDPNNKLVEPIGEGPAGYIEGTELLNYTINFQNTGTAPAVNVVLHDELPAELDLLTLEVIGASHNFEFELNGRKAIWKFNNIMLPDSFHNEPESHGFVKFTVRPVTGLNPGTAINNFADIYFDFNEAIRTNTATNTIKILSSVSGTESVEAIIQPNPVSQKATIRIESDEQISSIVITDIQGRVVAATPVNNNRFVFDRTGVPSGTYFYQIQSVQGKSYHGKILVN